MVHALKMTVLKKPVLVLILTSLPFLCVGQEKDVKQEADKSFLPEINNPAYDADCGPVIFIDEAHNNFHTIGGRYKPFADFLGKDGYRVRPFQTPFTRSALAQGKILVISNALHVSNLEKWELPTPSAFTEEEILAVREWVEGGGSLFLIADHMPMPGAAADLAAAFGFKFHNGYAVYHDKARWRPPVVFSRDNRTLLDHAIINGRDTSERIDSVATFTGQAFLIPDRAQPLLLFGSDYVLYFTEKVGSLTEETPKISAEGMFQGAVLEYGQGRLAVFGEAAMFTAQRVGERKMGMISPVAKHNPQFLLNIIHWLDRIIE
jgi:hypothetical protein